jgi:hypothetical protein
MLAPHDVPGGIRALGWDVQSAYSTNRGTALSRRAVGHGGYTGTSLWIDPEQDLFVIFLSNRVHPDGKGSINALAGAIATLAGSTLVAAEAPVELDRGSRLASTCLRLKTSPACAACASPSDQRQRPHPRRRAHHRRAGQPPRSCPGVPAQSRARPFGQPRRAHRGWRRRQDQASRRQPLRRGAGAARGAAAGPRPVTLPPAIDAVVVDLPDVGARFFTYASTLHATMRAAAERGLRVIVLDRPNPIDGVDVAAPCSRPARCRR